MRKAHHVSPALFKGAPLKSRSYSEVGAHRCNISWCVHPDHIDFVTQRENVAHQIAAGTHACITHPIHFKRSRK